MGEIDFLGARCRTDTNATVFGICDDNTQPWAYIDYNDEPNWVVKVKNDDGLPLQFVAVDKCLDIRDEHQKTVSTCDAMLLKESSIVFIELKDRDAPWIAKAISQLRSTIQIFSDNHDLNLFKHKRAFASNKKYPGYSYQMQDEMDEFKRETKVRLIIEANEIYL